MYLDYRKYIPYFLKPDMCLDYSDCRRKQTEILHYLKISNNNTYKYLCDNSKAMAIYTFVANV